MELESYETYMTKIVPATGLELARKVEDAGVDLWDGEDLKSFKACRRGVAEYTDVLRLTTLLMKMGK